MTTEFPESEEEKRAIEVDFPVELINRNSHRESKSRGTYRPVLNMHKWFARRPGSVFRHAILYSMSPVDSKKPPEDIQSKYLEDLDLADKTIVDPFMGGGTTVYEALRTGSKVVATDLNPVAWFITKKGVDDFDINEIEDAYSDIENKIADELTSYYSTPCRHCSGNHGTGQSKLASYDGKENSSSRTIAEAMYYFWVTSFPCVNESCDKDVRLFNDYVIAKQRSNSDDGSWVVCPSCSDVFVVNEKENEQICDCGFSFTPTEGNYDDGDYYCLDCGQEYNISDALERFESHDFKMYAVEYYCPQCDTKEYASLTDYDYALYDEVVEEFENAKGDLPIPEQEIPYGHNTAERNPVTDWYDKWSDMFNKRQLLCHGKLFNAILDIDDQNAREYLLLMASNLLNYKNMLTIYNTHRNHQEHLYINHAIIPRTQPVEGDFWGQTYGRSTFRKLYDSTTPGSLKAALEYKRTPIEFTVDDNDEVQTRKQSTPIIRKPEDEILCQSAENLPLEEGEADAVITDPPYYNNIQYAELSDFFYVWLRKGLWELAPEGQEYDEFKTELSPKIPEIVKNPERGLSSADFEQGLRRALEECHRVLDDDGIMCFTFHHKDPEAWEKVLEAAMSADFYVTAAWLLDSELDNNMHILNKQGIKYDILIVCRKRSETEQITWNSLEDRIYRRVDDLISEYDSNEAGFEAEEGNVRVAVFGKCLEEFSKHYGEVYEDGEVVTAQQAFSRVFGIIDNVMIRSGVLGVPDTADEITTAYALYLAGDKTIEYDTLSREVRGRGVTIDELKDEKLIKAWGNRLRILSPEDRANTIEEKIGGGGITSDTLTLIDKVHYCYYLFDNDKKLDRYLNEWQSTEFKQICEKLAESPNGREDPEIYERLSETGAIR